MGHYRQIKPYILHVMSLLLLCTRSYSCFLLLINCSYTIVFVTCTDDLTRVVLKEGPDYINANKVDLEVYTTGQINRYIAAQGPMQHTCKDFWQVLEVCQFCQTFSEPFDHTVYVCVCVPCIM